MVWTTSRELTLLHAGVKLGDLDGQAVNAVLQRVGAHVKGVGLVKKLPENIFCMVACKKKKGQGTISGGREAVNTQRGVSNQNKHSVLNKKDNMSYVCIIYYITLDYKH